MEMTPNQLSSLTARLEALEAAMERNSGLQAEANKLMQALIGALEDLGVNIADVLGRK